jgi:hypothetical protein
MTTIPTDHPLAVAATEAIRAGELAELERLLAANPELATARLGSGPKDAGARARRARCCTSPLTGPATTPTEPPSSACS